MVTRAMVAQMQEMARPHSRAPETAVLAMQQCQMLAQAKGTLEQVKETTTLAQAQAQARTRALEIIKARQAKMLMKTMKVMMREALYAARSHEMAVHKTLSIDTPNSPSTIA